jgi:hypothetical protein
MRVLTWVVVGGALLSNPSLAAESEASSAAELSSALYRVQFRDGSLWTTQGSYGSESSAMSALRDYSAHRKGKLWRVVLEDNGRETVLATLQS